MWTQLGPRNISSLARCPSFGGRAVCTFIIRRTVCECMGVNGDALQEKAVFFTVSHTRIRIGATSPVCWI